MTEEETAAPGKIQRTITHHLGNALNNALRISADGRADNGGSHFYLIEITSGAPDSGGLIYAVPPFQNGPVKEVGHNGISDEALLAIVLDRLEGFQEGPYRSRYNALAITKIEEALLWLNKRTTDRERRGVEGTHQV
jgi:hypothetical protein